MSNAFELIAKIRERKNIVAKLFKEEMGFRPSEQFLEDYPTHARKILGEKYWPIYQKMFHANQSDATDMFPMITKRILRVLFYPLNNWSIEIVND